MTRRNWVGIGVFTLVAAATWAAESTPFTVVIYNMENLHDADGVAVYDDYQPEVYTPRHMATKVTNAASLMTRFRGGEGPDIILFNEIEIDQTPSSSVDDVRAFLDKWKQVGVGDLMMDEPMHAELVGVPAEVWLLKALEDAGLRGYEMAVGDDQPSPASAERRKAIKNVTYSKFPIVAVRQHQVERARVILETEIDVAGHQLFVFNNHWKSGASSPQEEQVRIGNARVLRDRLDEILEANPSADIIVGGDLNSHYNQKARNPRMIRTGIDDELEVGYSEPALQSGESSLYNLWYELTPEQRGSDVYRGEWGTLMHIILSPGLYDTAGIQYQDNSFRVAHLPGINSGIAGAPIRWSSGGDSGSGYSDHLPIYAHFRTVEDGRTDRFMPLENPSDTPPSAEVFRVDYASADLTAALSVDSLPDDVDLRDGSYNHQLFRVKGEAVGARYPKVRYGGEIYDIYSPHEEIRNKLSAQAARDRSLEFYGVLGTYKGNWQFVVHDISWVP